MKVKRTLGKKALLGCTVIAALLLVAHASEPQQDPFSLTQSQDIDEPILEVVKFKDAAADNAQDKVEQ
ncbi:hypothetical protein BGW38_009069, partial [Lunasporangiospora selenospora]